MGLYERLTTLRNDSKELKECMETAVQELLSKETNAEHPGMLLGDIQSGKTRAFIGIIALGFDKKYDITVVFTKGTKVLIKQTVQRLKNEFKEFEKEDLLRIYDIMEMPRDLNEFVIEKQKLIIVVKKEDDNIHRLTQIFFETYPTLQHKKVLIVDDEADFASIGYKKTKNAYGEKELSINIISGQISDFRKSLIPGSDYLQVTATPYSLYLQPDDIVVKDKIFAPMRPKFTVLLPIHDKYVGSDYYFEESKKSESPAQYLFQAVEEVELKNLSKTHGTILHNVLWSKNIHFFRTAIVNYIVASCIRIIQSEKEGKSNHKTSFIVHTETGKVKHQNQLNVVTRLVESLKVEGKMKSSVLRETLNESYDNLKLSIQLTEYYLPHFEDVFEKACEYVRYITIRKVNSDNDVLSILNIETGELRLESPLNIFIGGQILDRGITIQNLIGFFYGRNPQRMQQDTVMQHARIFGTRSLEDMAVTRLYTTQRIYEALRRMHEADKALRKAFQEKGIRQNVAFIQKAADGKIIPCSPNKILISNTVTLKPAGTLPIYGFQTKAKTHIAKTVSNITLALDEESKSKREVPFVIPLGFGLELIDMVYETFENANEVYGCTKEEFKAALEYTTKNTEDKLLKEHLYCFTNLKPKRSSRYKENQRGKMFNDVSYDGRTDAKEAKSVAIDIPCLFLSFQEGNKEENGWRDANFYWPVLFIQKNLITSIFTTNVDPDENLDDDLTDDTGPMRNQI